MDDACCGSYSASIWLQISYMMLCSLLCDPVRFETRLVLTSMALSRTVHGPQSSGPSLPGQMEYVGLE